MGNVESSALVDPDSSLRALMYGVSACVLGYFAYKHLLRPPLQNLAGKVVLITGASGGLGKALAAELYKHGCVLIITGRSASNLEDAKREILDGFPTDEHSAANRIMTYEMDIGNIEKLPASVEGLVDAISAKREDRKFVVDILVNNAGISQRTDFIDTPINSHCKIFDVNYFGPVFLTKLLMPYLLESEHPTVVNICSLQSWISMPGRCAYSASKFAFRAFGDSLRNEMGNKLRVLSVYPGYIATNIDRNAFKKDDEAPSVEKHQKCELSAEDSARRIVRGLQNPDETDLMLYNDFVQRFAVLLSYVHPALLSRKLFKRHEREVTGHQ